MLRPFPLGWLKGRGLGIVSPSMAKMRRVDVGFAASNTDEHVVLSGWDIESREPLISVQESLHLWVREAGFAGWNRWRREVRAHDVALMSGYLSMMWYHPGGGDGWQLTVA